MGTKWVNGMTGLSSFLSCIIYILLSTCLSNIHERKGISSFHFFLILVPFRRNSPIKTGRGMREWARKRVNGKEHQVKGKEKGCLASYGKVTPKASFSRVFVRPYLSYHFWRLIAGEQRREERPDDTKGKELKRRDKRYKQNSYSFYLYHLQLYNSHFSLPCHCLPIL